MGLTGPPFRANTRELQIAPATAMPAVCPRVRITASSPLATPSASGGAFPSTVLLFGLWNSPIPAPSSIRKPTSCHRGVVGVVKLFPASATAESTRPVIVRARGPKRSESRPLIGEVSDSVSGSAISVRPVVCRSNLNTNWRNSGISSRLKASPRNKMKPASRLSEKTGLRNMRRSIIGCGARSSQATKPAAATTNSPSRP